MKQKQLFTIIALGFALIANAQKPFKEIGKDNEVELLTLSNGRYVEHFTNDTLRRIGSVMFNTVSNKIEYFIPPDDIAWSAELDRAKEASRWLSIDPMAQERSWVSPYNFVQNNPITRTDPTGALDDDIRINTSTQEVTINPTNGKVDRVFIDGKYSGTRAKGTSIDILEAQGFKTIQGPRIEGVGMGAVDMGIAAVSGSALVRLLYTAANTETKITKTDANQVKSQIKNSSGYEKQTDSQLLRSKDKYEKLIEEHKQKIKDFEKDPEGQSDPDLLKTVRENAPDKVKDFFKGRVNALEKQLKKQDGELNKINKEIDNRGL